MDNTQLPDEVSQAIEMKGQELLAFEPDNRLAYRKGATEYATKLHKVEKALELYKQADKTNSDLIERAVTLLEKVKSRHEAGLLPDRFIYNEIKSFLDGK
jgi:hypothetical protein